MDVLIFLYFSVLIGGVIVLGATLYVNSETMTISARRRASQIALLLPVWPLAIPYILFKLLKMLGKGIKRTWTYADWQGVKYDYEHDGDYLTGESRY